MIEKETIICYNDASGGEFTSRAESAPQISDGTGDIRIMDIPFFENNAVNRYRMSASPDTFITIPYNGVAALSFAMPAEYNSRDGASAGAMVLEEVSTENIDPSKLHLIATSHGEYLCFIEPADPTCYRLISPEAENPDPEILTREQILSLFVLRSELKAY